LYHVLGVEKTSSMLTDGYYSTLSPNQGSYVSLLVTTGMGVKLNNSAMVSTPNLEASNGVIHVIDEVILPPNVVDIAVSNPNFSTLVSALVKADLADVLATPGTFTVFAPTNAAFEALFNDLGVAGLDDLSAEALEPILLYHVFGVKKSSSMITDGYYSTLSPAQGSYVSLLINTSGGVKLNNSAMVTAANIEATNGVIHVIDEVILPPNVVEIAINNPTFSTLVEAVVKAELVETLSGTGPFTVFAPTNDAFSALFSALPVTGIVDLSKEALTPILLYHVVAGNVESSQLINGNVTTVGGSNITIALGNPPTVNGTSQIVVVDVQGTNGIVHAITEVLLPPTK
jgi:transforming growth factor-beta-induced protein